MSNPEPHGHGIEEKDRRYHKTGYGPGWQKRPLSDEGKEMLARMRDRRKYESEGSYEC